MQIIDFRCRPPFGNFTKDWIFDLEDRPGNHGLKRKYGLMAMELPKSLLQSSMSEFFSECSESGIAHTVVPLRKLATQDNRDLVKLLETYPDHFTGFAGLQPVEEGIRHSIAQIEQFVLDGPCAGVYMEPGLDPEPWNVDSHIFFPIYDFCQRNSIPVYLLYGGVFHRDDSPGYEIYSPARIERLAAAFPDLHILLSHACWPFAAQACAIALNWENVWLSPDGFMIDHPASMDYTMAANYRLQDKIIFGSLYPSMPMGYAVQRCKEELRPEVWEKVFRKNAESFLNKKMGTVSPIQEALEKTCELSR